jgi:drug/metabolite transporter (DMT)-like permease
MQATPIIMTILCAILGIELIDWRRWLAVLVGFAGVALIAQPGGADFSIYSLAALTSATFVALRDLVTRKISSEIPPAVVILTTTIFACCGGFILGLSETWHPPTLSEISLLAGAAVIVTLANSLMVVAYRYADVSILSPLRYLVVVWAAMMGFVVFGEIPVSVGAIGAALIIASGLYTGYQERAKHRRMMKAAA